MKKSFYFFLFCGLLVFFLTAKEVPVRITSSINKGNRKYKLARAVNDFHLIFPTLSSILHVQSSFYAGKLGLLKCGDIESNPGPLISFKTLTKTFKDNNNRLKFFHINAQSLLRKRLTLQDMILDLGPNCIFGISETWLKDIDDKKLWNVKPELYKTFRMDRQCPNKDRGGGVMLIVPIKLNPKIREDLNHLNKTFFESLWIECNMTTKNEFKKKQLINISYNPKKTLYHLFLEQLSQSIDSAITENKPITLMGDYNIDYMNEREMQDLETVIIPYGFKINNIDQPTRVRGNSKSLIDYIISDHFQSESFNAYVSDTPLRTANKQQIDHFATSLITNIDCKSTSKVFKKTIFNKQTYQREKFQNILQASDWGYFYSQNCAEGMFSVFVNFLENALEKSISKRKVFIRNDKNNLTIYQKLMKTEKKQNFDRILEHSDPSDLTKQKLHQNYIDNLHDNLIINSKKAFNNLKTDREKWNFINEMRNSRRTKTQITSLRNVFGDIITNQKQIANFLNYKFSKLGDFLGQPTTYNKPANGMNRMEFTFRPITLHQCRKLIQNLNLNKPLGPSNIPAWALKDSINIIGEPLTFLVNAFLQECRFPNHLKRAHIVPIFKNGVVEDPNNYQPISTVSAISEIFEIVFQNQIIEYLDASKLLSTSQYEFTVKFLTADALLYATETIPSDIDDKNVVAAAFLDFSRVWDSNSHEIPMQELYDLHFTEGTNFDASEFFEKPVTKK